MALRTVPEGVVVDLVAAAVKAPSSHNTQPWIFTVRQGEVKLFADRSRALPVNDPDDRELIMSCGAALFNLRVAAAAAGLEVSIDRWPDATQPDLAATVHVDRMEAALADQRLAQAIDGRRTHRGPFAMTP